MTIAYEVHQILEKTIKSDAAGGIFVNDIKSMLQYHVGVKKLDIPFPSGVFYPTIEMYLLAKGIHYEKRVIRNVAKINGITFKTDQVWDWLDVLTSGIQGSPEQTARARDYYDSIIK